MNYSPTKDLAPIILFVYNRPDLTKQTIKALLNNVLSIDSEIYVFSDGNKSEKDESYVKEVRSFIKNIVGFKSVKIFESQNNKGLANSIIQGVSEVMKNYDKVIVLEDDLYTTPNFLQFMNDSLNFYSNEKHVFSISGYSFNLGVATGEKFDAYLLNRGWSWGWATWKDRWEDVDWKVKTYEKFVHDSNARKEFSSGGSDLNKMLDAQMNHKLDSWAIRWFYHQFANKGLTVYPVYSKVHNNGFGVEATHTKGSDKRYIPLIDTLNNNTFRFPNSIENSTYYQQIFVKKMGYWSRFISKIQTILHI